MLRIFALEYFLIRNPDFPSIFVTKRKICKILMTSFFQISHRHNQKVKQHRESNYKMKRHRETTVGHIFQFMLILRRG